MKKLISLTLVFLLAALCLTALAEAAPDGAANNPFLSTWVCGRASIEFTEERDGYRAFISWAGSAFEVAEWTYACEYDATGNVMNAVGAENILTYGEDGEVANTETVYTDGKAAFAINEAGLLTWADAVEDAGKDMEFERTEILSFE